MNTKFKAFAFFSILFLNLQSNLWAKNVKLSDYLSLGTIAKAFNSAQQSMSEDDVLLIDPGTYNMNELVFINKKITIQGTDADNKPVFIKVSSSATNNSRYIFVVNADQVKFENLVLDGANIIKNAIINTNDKTGVQVINCLLKNTGYETVTTGSYSGASAIASETLYNGNYKPGTPTSGLIVKGCDFLNIGNVCVYVINRNTIVAGREINKIDPVIVENCSFTNYNRGIIADCGNDYEIPNCKSSKLRYQTNLNGSTYKNNTFGQADLWHIGKVQATNVNIIGNEMAGPKDTEEHKSDPITCIHIEELSDSILIQNNTLTNSLTRGKIIDIQCRKKWMDCDTKYPTNDVNRFEPTWVPKGVKILDNTFSGPVNVCIAGYDIKGIVIARNNFTECIGNKIVNFEKGGAGCCDITMPVSGPNKNTGIIESKIHIEWEAGCTDNNAYKDLPDVGITSIYKNSDRMIKIYPNPSVNTDFINICFNENPGKVINITISNLEGRVVYKSNQNVGKAVVPSVDLVKGMYIVMVENENKLFTSKLMVQ